MVMEISLEKENPVSFWDKRNLGEATGKSGHAHCLGGGCALKQEGELKRLEQNWRKGEGGPKERANAGQAEEGQHQCGVADQ